MPQKCHFLLVEPNADYAFLLESGFQEMTQGASFFRCHNLQEAEAYIRQAAPFADRRKFPEPHVVIAASSLGDLAGWMPAESTNRLLLVQMKKGPLADGGPAQEHENPSVLELPGEAPDVGAILDGLAKRWNYTCATAAPGQTL